MKATAEIYLDPREKATGECSVKIRVTYNRKRKYYSTGIDLTVGEFEKIIRSKRRSHEQKAILTKLEVFKAKANKVIDNLKVFTFTKFSEGYFESRDVNNDVSYAFDKKIEELKENGKIGTAVTYECSKKSIIGFKSNLTFAEITPSFLRKYEKKMLEKGRSTTTISMYLRSLRSIYNAQNIDKTLYPFGRGKNKYTIPTAKNIKKALTLDEVAKIYNYEPITESEAMARDYWMFLYLCNGMNVKDFCLLKWENINNDIITYERAKTSSTNSDKKEIRIALKDESKAIINKWGVKSLNKEAFVFPHLIKEMTPEKQRRVYQDLTKLINKYIQRITKKLEIPHHVTTYSARHSFATVLKRSGANISMISDLLGHSDLKVTQNYLDSFENEQIQAQTDVLTTGFNIAK
ncbi:site-specific integrase [Mangrovimonas sp. ST2L15]|uniref:site-specific integrase n=1 Tax=Mangrovimonas sp. ST2L15 TaxID=1645916 RepID=UPI0006B404AA|nr:site-specific integrase [Mangrovimonas sp. ST2L15]